MTSGEEDLEAALADLTGAGLEPWNELSVERARELDQRLFGGDGTPAVGAVTEGTVPGPASPVDVRRYEPEGTPAAVVVFVHGGGFVVGSPDSADDVCRTLASRLPAEVVSVDYRLAPEHPFPAALEDAVAAVEWAGETRAGRQPDDLVVAGTSAGAGLAAATALYDRELRALGIDHQLLAYPMVDATADAAGEDPLLSRADCEWFWAQYCRSPIDRYNPFASPAAAADLAGLPSATVLTGGRDPLGEEGAAFAERLAGAGVPVTHLAYRELPHGFLSLGDRVDAAAAAVDDLLAAVRSALDDDRA